MSPPQLPPNSGEPVPSPSEEGTVAVVVRVRPSTACERERDPQPIVHVIDEHMLIFDPEEPGGPPGSVLPLRGPRHQGKDLKFIFDRVFGEGATQEEVFQHTTHDMLDSVLNGYNCSVFAYGATGAGKTHTMLGSEKSPGIMYLTMVELYKRIEARKEEKSCEVLVSYQEVYNEQIHDLLEPKGPLTIREDPEKGVVVRGLSFHQPTSAEQLLEMLANGNKNRTQHPTDANATSSRSHAVFQIYVKQQDRIRGITQELQVSKMSLIDLAGSERASVANTRGERLREGANINRSLLALINVIKALADAKSKKTHIPYRDSKLTRLLKDSIGGNCRTVMIAAVSPSVLAYEDTYNTLKYANRAKEIKLSLKSNVLSFDCHVSKYVVICEQLKAEVAGLRAKLRAYEEAARESQNKVLELQNQASQAPSPGGLPSLEEAVPKRCLALDGQQERDGEEQEPEAGWPVQMQLESEQEVGEGVPEEMPPSSLRVTDQADVPLEPKEPTCLPQGLSGSQTETLIAAILSVARKQYALLKDSNLLTPDMVSEFEELERLVRQEAAVSLEKATSPSRPTEVGEAAPALGTKLGSDAVVSVAAPSTRVTRAARPGLRRLASLSSPSPVATSPIKKRRMSSETRSASQPAAPRSLKTRPKRQRKCAKEAEAPRVAPILDTPCPETAAPAPTISPVASAFTPKICPPKVTKSRAPLATSAAQNHRASAARNGCAPPAPNLNVTFEIHKVGALPEPASFSTPQHPDWENIQNLLNKQESPFVPKSRIRVFAVKGSSIPKPSISKASSQKRKRVESTSDPSLDGLQGHVAQLPSSSQKSGPPSRIPEHPALAWKRKKTTTVHAALGSATPASTSQPMKLLC